MCWEIPGCLICSCCIVSLGCISMAKSCIALCAYSGWGRGWGRMLATEGGRGVHSASLYSLLWFPLPSLHFIFSLALFLCFVFATLALLTRIKNLEKWNLPVHPFVLITILYSFFDGFNHFTFSFQPLLTIANYSIMFITFGSPSKPSYWGCWSGWNDRASLVLALLLLNHKTIDYWLLLIYLFVGCPWPVIKPLSGHSILRSLNFRVYLLISSFEMLFVYMIVPLVASSLAILALHTVYQGGPAPNN